MSGEASLGWCERQVEEELPELRIALAQARMPPRAAPSRPASEPVRERLAALSDRFNGAKAVSLRREPVTAAYRVFFRHIGLDPDVVRTPIEAAVLERMLDGGFLSRCLLEDVLLIALLDTGVPVWALDASTVEGPLGVRTSHAGESLGRDRRAEAGGAGAGEVVGVGEVAGAGGEAMAGGGAVAEGEVVGAGQLVVADSRGALSLLFAEPAAAHRPTPRTRGLLLYALQVAGVPWLAVEEALWICRSALEAVE